MELKFEGEVIDGAMGDLSAVVANVGRTAILQVVTGDVVVTVRNQVGAGEWGFTMNEVRECYCCYCSSGDCYDCDC
jgi:hypothetical protein